MADEFSNFLMQKQQDNSAAPTDPGSMGAMPFGGSMAPPEQKLSPSTDKFNIIPASNLNQEQTKDPFMDRVASAREGIQGLQQKLIQKSQPQLKDIVDGQLKSLTGYNKAQEGLVQSQANEAINKLLYPSQFKSVAGMMDQAMSNPMGSSLGGRLLGGEQAQAGLVEGSTASVAQNRNQVNDATITTQTAASHAQKNIVDSNQVLADSFYLYDNFKQDDFTLGGKLRQKGEQLGAYVGMPGFFKDTQSAEAYRNFMQKADTAFFNYIKLTSGTAFTDKEIQTKAKIRFNSNMGPVEAKAALTGLLQDTITFRMAQNQALEKGSFSSDPAVKAEQVRKMALQQQSLEYKKLNTFVDQFMADPQNKAKGVTKTQALRYYMYINKLN